MYNKMLQAESNSTFSLSIYVLTPNPTQQARYRNRQYMLEWYDFIGARSGQSIPRTVVLPGQRFMVGAMLRILFLLFFIFFFFSIFSCTSMLLCLLHSYNVSRFFLYFVVNNVPILISFFIVFIIIPFTIIINTSIRRILANFIYLHVYLFICMYVYIYIYVCLCVYEYVLWCCVYYCACICV